jgi:murein DD-endopeptidase MepM/ murein hydrolase activator NlpD
MARIRMAVPRWVIVAAIVPLGLLDAGAESAPVDVRPVMRVVAPAPTPDVPVVTAAPLARSSPALDPIAGWIIDGAGRPIAGIVATHDGKHATSDDTGAFRLPVGTPGNKLILDGPSVFAAEVAWHAGEPPRIMLARKAHASVHVTAGGVPVAGAVVELSDGSRQTLATAWTDADGRARFGDLVEGQYELWARRASSTSPLARVADLDDREIELVLAPAGGVTGHVVAQPQLPADTTARAVVSLAPLDVDHAMRVGKLDARGGFSFDGVPAGRWRVEAAAPGYVYADEQVVSTRAGTRSDVTVRIESAGIASGRVVDASGAPVANATVVLRRQDDTTREVELDRAPRAPTVALRWVHPLASPRRLPIEPGRFGAERPGKRPAECGRGHCGVDLGNKRGEVIHAAADGLVIGVYREIHGEEGRYVVLDHGGGTRTAYLHMNEVRPGLEVGQHVLAGDAIGTVGTTGFALNVPHLHFAITQEYGGRAWFIDPEPMLQHAVVLATPKPFDAVAVDARTLIATSDEQHASTMRAPPTTDANGRWRIDSVAPGTYVAMAFAENLAPGVSTSFTIASGAEMTDIPLTLRLGGSVHGRVLGRDGPIAGATITATSGSGESASKLAASYTNAAGEYGLHAVSGNVTLVVTAPGYGDGERTLVVDDGPGARHEDFELIIEDAQLRAQVLAPDGGVAGPVDVVVLQGPTHRRVTTNASGEILLDHVAAGTYTLELSNADYPATRVTLTTNSFQELHMASGGNAHLTVYDARSWSPLADARVTAVGPNKRTVQRLTDKNGVADLRALATGAWTLDVRLAGYANVEKTLAIPGNDVRIELARGARVAGVVRDRFGRRLDGARVAIGTLAVQADSDGSFMLSDAPSGEVTISAESGDLHAAQSLTLVPGDDRGGVELEATAR